MPVARSDTNRMVEFRISEGLVEYSESVRLMEKRVEEIRTGSADEAVWLLEHPPLYTAGTSAKPSDLLNPHLLPVFKASRGGQFTYHGPGQRIAYTMLDLNRRGRNVREFVRSIERWAIAALSEFGIEGRCRNDRVGVWVVRNDLPALQGGAHREDKVAAVGIRLRRWISFHGLSINVSPELGHYEGIVPCGIREHGITSFKDMGVDATMSELDQALIHHFDNDLAEC
ncbi:MAG: lipoyl(octanoyl) transferase LipB [Albidovulum sp.]|nr:lipoyl(octanoyl) transferase LipB [Albidovulum sp.]